MKKLLTAAALTAFAMSGHATLTSSTTGDVTTITENFNGGNGQCAYMTFVNGNCVSATPGATDGYLQIAPGLLNNSSSASFSYNYGSTLAVIQVSFYYSTALNFPSVFEFGETSFVLSGTGFNSQNPGSNNPSTEQAYFNHTIQGVSGGSQTLLFSTGTGNLRGLKIDDLQITITPVRVPGSITGIPVTPIPEPETLAMLLAGLGLIGAVARRRKVKQA